MLSVLDGLWKDHLLNMDHLKEGIGLRGYAQQDPLVAYKKESFEMFEQMMFRFQEDTARHLFRMQIMAPDGTPIETEEQLARLQVIATPPPKMPTSPQLAPPQQPQLQRPQDTAAAGSHRAPSTTIDALEREFERKKQNELNAAAWPVAQPPQPPQPPPAPARNSAATTSAIGGSGKKYKKCHGANA